MDDAKLGRIEPREWERMSLHRRPGERRDPYRGISLWHSLGDDHRNHNGLGLLIPAFAGTSASARALLLERCKSVLELVATP